MKIILASSSPRRKELLSSIIKDEFLILPSKKEEIIEGELSIKNAIIEIAKQKADDVAKRTYGDRIIIASDTVVVINGKILGKPLTEEKSKEYLKILQGKKHNVYSSLYVVYYNQDETKAFSHLEDVIIEFKNLSEEEIDDYVLTKEPLDKAGAYAYQGGARKFIKSLKGEENAVIGLPTKKLKEILQLLGVTIIK